MALVIATPISVFAGGSNMYIPSTDIRAEYQLSSYYDLRNRKTYIQVTNDSEADGRNSVLIHVQIFQHDRDCAELNFFDELTRDDTVVYDLDNLVRNDGSAVPASLLDDSYGYVVITTDDGTESQDAASLIGNARIIDDKGYEYRLNMVGTDAEEESENINDGKLIANFNTIDGAMYADVVGYGYDGTDETTVTNLTNGYGFDVFVFDMDEEPLSCDNKRFACGAVMNYGINENYLNSRGGPLLCPGGFLADPQGGFISFENGTDPDADDGDEDGDQMFIGLIGINNDNGTGSMDVWWYDEGFD